MRSEKTTTTSILVVSLIYAFIVGNTSGDLVLCIGAKGQVALRPVIHEHNHNHTHIEQNDPSATEHQHDRHVQSPHLKTCVDIPIFIGPTDNQLPLKPVKPNPETLVSLLEPATNSDHQFILPTVPCRSYFATDENRFLRSIILLV